MSGPARCFPFLAHRAAAIALPLLLAGCAAGTTAPSSGPSPPPSQPSPGRPSTQPYAPPSTGFIRPKIMRMRGLDGVIGNNASGLSRMFGSPVLDVREGDARKLQFGGRPCVLDIYLYPLKQGGEPRATYVDARRQSDGRDVNRADCVAALKR